MDIIPAIDLQNSQCVRLYKGDFKQSIIYAKDPVAVAKKFAQQGAKFIHVVDLDGAKHEQMDQTKIIKQIASQTNLKVQTGGGIRNTEQINELLQAGISKIVIGSLAIQDPLRVQDWLRTFGNEKIVIAFDVKIINNQPRLAVSGWQQQSKISLWDALKIYQAENLKYILCTAIDQDGTLAGPNLLLYKELVKRYPNLHIQASGGISSITDLINLKKINIDAVVIGKALYENKFTIKEALQC